MDIKIFESEDMKSIGSGNVKFIESGGIKSIESDGKSLNADLVPALILPHESICVPIQLQRFGLMKWVNKEKTNIDKMTRISYGEVFFL